MITVSHSEAESFVRCSRQHYYQYGLSIQPIGRSISDATYRGIIVHDALQVYFNALKNREKSPAAFTKMLTYLATDGGSLDGYTNTKIQSDAVNMLSQFHTFRGAEIAEWQILEVESSAMYKIHSGLQTQIRPDLVARIPGKGYTVVDHKTVYNFIDPTLLALLPQLPKYFIGLREKYDIQHAMFNQIRFRELADATNLTNKFQFTYPPMNQTRLIQTMKEHVKVSSRIEKLRSLPSLSEWEDWVVRTANKTVCQNCSFKQLCRAEMLGDDTTLMLANEFQPKKRRELVLVDD